MTKEEIYDRMVMQYVVPDKAIECEFEDGKPCMELYGKVSDARMRISARTGIAFDDPDLIEIIESMEEITRICMLKMYDYAVKFAASPE